MSSSSASASPSTPDTPASPSTSPSVSPSAKIKIFFQDLRRDSRQKFGSLFGGVGTPRRKRCDHESTPILFDISDAAEHKEHSYGATYDHINESFTIPMSATKTAGQNDGVSGQMKPPTSP